MKDRPSSPFATPVFRLRACRAGWPQALLALGLAVLAPLASADGWPEERAQELRAEALRQEHGEGVARDPARAAALYCQASLLGDAVSQFNLGWMYAHGRGVERNDAWAAFFFQAAADHGVEQAVRMLEVVGGPTPVVPDCMKPPPRPGVEAPLAAAAGSGDALPPLTPMHGPRPKAIVDMVQKVAPEYGVEPRLALAIMQAESNYNPLALSPKNAKGLMQLIPETADRFRVKDPYDAKQNLRGGLAYLRWLLAYFQGDLSLVAAAYNAGEGAVNRHHGVPPYAETRNYVSRVLATVGALAHPFNAAVTPPSPQLPSMRKPPTREAVAIAAVTVAPGTASRVRRSIP